MPRAGLTFCYGAPNGPARASEDRSAVGDFLQRLRQDQMLRQLNEVYACGLETTEKQLLNRIKSKVRATVKESW